MKFGIVTDIIMQMLNFDGHWHAGLVFSSRMNPGFNCTWQMADSVFGVVGASSLPHGGGGVIVWASISYGQRKQLHFIDSNLNAQRYRDELLRPIVRPIVRCKICEIHRIYFQLTPYMN